MTIYTVILITHRYRVNKPQVWVFNNQTDAESFAYTWMHNQSGLAPRSQFTMSYDELEQHCIDRDICSVDIQSHRVRIPRSYND